MGDAFVEQILGVPMGGHLSKCMMGILLCVMERDLFNDRDWLERNDFFPKVLQQARVHPTESAVPDSGLSAGACPRSRATGSGRRPNNLAHPIENAVQKSSTVLRGIRHRIVAQDLDGKA